MAMKIELKIPYTEQGKESGNCGPCSIKMIADYYGIRKETGDRYSVPSLNRLCRVTKEWGCEKSDVNRVLRRLGLKKTKVNYTDLKKHLSKKKPVLSLIIDESGIGHYTVIKGIEKDQVIFNDSYWGKNFKRPLNKLKQQSAFFNHWHWAIEPISP
jgi:ABC-type bacteriocin/lantibiotic exporter with double-glycine peptidase domain